MNIKAIKNQEDYELALKGLNEILHAQVDSKEGDEAEIFTILIKKYEDTNYPIQAPNPIEAIKFRGSKWI